MTLHTQVLALPESAFFDAGAAIARSFLHVAGAIKRIYTLPRAEDYLDFVVTANNGATFGANTLGWMARDAHFPKN